MEMNQWKKFYKVADLTFQIISDYPVSENTFHPKFKLFEVDTPGDDNITIYHHFEPYNFSKTQLPQNQIFFNPQWSIYKNGDIWTYKFCPILPEEPGCPVTAIINKTHTIIDIYIENITKSEYKNGQFSALTLFNSDQVLFSKLLCDRQGLILHSNGININGNGILLTGQSGSGKSTLSKILKQRGFEILCDDRMFVKKKENHFWIHGNWCHGSVAETSQSSVPLNAIFFLKQSKMNTIDIIHSKKTIFQNLIPAMVKPFLTKDDWNITLETLEDIIQNIKCYFLYFDLSGNICEQIEGIFPHE